MQRFSYIFFVNYRRKFHGIRINTTECKQRDVSKKDNFQKGKKTEPKNKVDSRHKYEQYFNFSVPANHVKPHQVS